VPVETQRFAVLQVSQAGITVSGATGTATTFQVGDTVKVAWDASEGGNTPADVVSVTVNMFAITHTGAGGNDRTAVPAADDGAGGCDASADDDVWTACYTLLEGDGTAESTPLDSTTAVATVTANDAGQGYDGDSAQQKVDTASPTVTTGKITVCGDTATVFQAGDTVTVAWDNRASGDDNGDLAAANPVSIDMFGITDVNATVSTGGCVASNPNVWVASYLLQADDLDALNQTVSATVTDDAGNATTRVDDTGYNVDTTAPTVTTGNIAVCGATGTGGAFKEGDTVTVVWDNRGVGDNNGDLAAVTPVAVSMFGVTNVNAANNTAGCAAGADADVWVASYELAEDDLDDTNQSVTVTATDDGGNATPRQDDAPFTVDTDSPVVSGANTTVCGATGTGGAFKSGDTVTVAWDNRAAGDNNGDLAAADPVAVSMFGITSVNAANSTAGCALPSNANIWVASYVLQDGDRDELDDKVTVTATDDVGNATAQQDETGYTVDAAPPDVTTGNITVCGDTGGVFQAGDTVTVVWDDRAGGDNNGDPAAVDPVAVSMFGITSVNAANSTAACALPSHADVWVASYQLQADDRDALNQTVTVTVTDDVGNSTAQADDAGYNVDCTVPTVTTGNITVCGATGTAGAFKEGDTVTVVWDNSGGGDNNDDLAAVTPVAVSMFGVTNVNAANSTEGCAVGADVDVWVASYQLQEDDLDDTGQSVTVTATDDGANATPQADDGSFTVDTDSPLVTGGEVEVCGDTGGVFQAGDTVTVAWDNRGSGDDNGDLAAVTPVAVGMFGITSVNATVSTEGCGLNNADVWVASYVLQADDLDALDQSVTVTATDDVGNATATVDEATFNVDTTAPIVTPGNVAVCGATGTAGAFKLGDTVTVVWDNSGGGDDNDDLAAVTPVVVSMFGIGDVNAANNTAGCAAGADADVWVATYELAEDDLDDTNQSVTVTATDDGGNVTAQADDGSFTVDTDSPIVTDGNITVCGDTGGVFQAGDTVLVAWDNRAAGDNEGDLAGGTPVSVDMFAITDVNATVSTGGCLANDANVWVASYELQADDLDALDQSVSVTATDDAGNATTVADDETFNVDTTAPTVSTGNITVCGATGTGSAFKTGDTVTVVWDNRGGADGNTDLAAVTPVAVDMFGITDVDAAANVAGCAIGANADVWVATYELAEDDLDDTNQSVTVTATDDGGNDTARADDGTFTVDTDSPAVTGGNTTVCGASGTAGAFKLGDTVTVVWDNRAAGDDNDDLAAATPVVVSMFGIGNVNATASTEGCELAANAQRWVASYELAEDDLDDTNQAATVTVTDDVGNVTAQADNSPFTVDTDSPIVTNGNITVCGDTGGVFQAGDTVYVAWDNRGGGDDEDDLAGGTPVSVSIFGITDVDAAVSSAGCLANNANVWVASYELQADDLDALAQTVSVTATDDAGNATTTADDTTYNVDTTVPVLSAGNITVCGATGTGGAFKTGDTVSVAWDNRASGDNNGDLAAVTPVSVSMFGVTDVDAANNTAGCALPSSADVWVASYELAEDDLDALNQTVSVTATDDGGNDTAQADDTGYTVDTDSPEVSQGNVTVCGDAGGVFQAGDTVTVVWDARAAGDDMDDPAAADPVSVDVFGITDVNAANDTAGCALGAHAQVWVATYLLQADDLDALGQSVAVTVSDDVGNTDATADDGTFNVDTIVPVVSTNRISVCGATGTGGAFKTGDTVTVVWDNRASGDNNGDLAAVTPVSVSFFGIDNGNAANNDAGCALGANANVWVATYELQEGDLDDLAQTVSVSATDDGGNTTVRADDTGYEVDTTSPTVTGANTTVCGATGTGGAYKTGDTITVVWDNTGGGDDNDDLRAATPVQIDLFGITSLDASASTAGCELASDADRWVASYELQEGDLDAVAQTVGVTATDDVANETTQADDTGFIVDTTTPTVSATEITVCGATGSGGAFQTGDEVKVEWDNRAGSGDGNTDLAAVTPVQVSFFGITVDDAAASTAGCTLGANANVWVATYTLLEGDLDATSQTVSVTVTDDAGNSRARVDDTGYTVDTTTPTVTAGNITVCGATGTAGAFRTGDTVTVVWDNRAAGDDNDDLAAATPVQVDFFGITSLNAAVSTAGCEIAANADRWVASYELQEGDLDAVGQSIEVTVTDDAANDFTRTDDATFTVDTTTPTVSASQITVCGATGAGGRFRTGDTVKVEWDNRAGSGDGNTDLAAVTPVQVSFFGITAGDAAASTASCASGSDANVWVASYELQEGDLDATGQTVDVTATDDVGNTRTRTDDTGYTVDTTTPTVTAGRIVVCGATGTGGAFRTGDTVTVVWDNRGSGDDNDDLAAATPVQIDFFGITMDDAAASTAGCELAANAQRWVAAYELQEGDLDALAQTVGVTVTDDASNSFTRADDTGYTVDTTMPAVTTGRITVCGATGSAGAFKTGDTIRVEWDNRASGDDNDDLRALAPVQIDFFGITALDAAANTQSCTAGSNANVWVASYVLQEGDLDDVGQTVDVTVTDDVANARTVTDDSGYTVDTTSPTVTAPRITVCGDDTGLFQAGDTVTVVWDNRGGGDGNTDLAAVGPVRVNFFGIDGETAVVAEKSTAGCGINANANRWTASYQLQAGDLDALDQSIDITAEDDAGNTTTTTDDATYNVDTNHPVMSTGRIHVCGASGTGGAFRSGDTIKVEWDNRGAGDGNTDLRASNPVQIDFFGIAGQTTVNAAKNTAGCVNGQGANVWVATYTLQEGDLDALNQKVVVTATDDGANTTPTTDDTGYEVDTTFPVVTTGEITVCGATGTDGAFRTGDTVKVEWDNRASGDNTVDLAASTPVQVDFYGIAGATAVDATNETAGCVLGAGANTWVATYTLQEGDLDALSQKVAVTATDDVGNTTPRTDDTGYEVDTTSPTVTGGETTVCGESGTGGAFRSGDTITVVWDNRAAGGDNNDDLAAANPVRVNFFGIADQTAIAATASQAACNLGANAQRWVASYTLQEDDLDALNQRIRVSVTDDVANTTTTTDNEGFEVDTTFPVVTVGKITVCGAEGTDGAFKTGDTVWVVWDNRGAGDNNPDLAGSGPVKVDFFGIGGQTSVSATANRAACSLAANAQRWTASYTLLEGDLDALNQKVSVTVHDDVNNITTTEDDTGFEIDTTSPTVTTGKTHVCGATGTNGAFRTGDTVSVVWDNRAAGDDNPDLADATPVTVNFFGIAGQTVAVAGTGQAACNLAANAQRWVASYTLLEGDRDSTNQKVAVTVTDDVANVTTTTDNTGFVVDTTSPTVTAGEIHLCGASGEGGAFKTGDQVRVVWDNRVNGGDGNRDLAASNPVKVDFFGIAGATSVVAQANVTGCAGGWGKHTRRFVANYRLQEGDLDALNQKVSVTVHDDVNNITTTQDDRGKEVDTTTPTVTGAEIAVDTSDAKGFPGPGQPDGHYFIVGDRIRATWDNRDAGGDGNGDVRWGDRRSAVTMDFSTFASAGRGGAASSVTARDDGGNEGGCVDDAAGDQIWTACWIVQEGDVEGTGLKVTVNPTDDVGNLGGGTDVEGYRSDGVSPTVDLDAHGVASYNEGALIQLQPDYAHAATYGGFDWDGAAYDWDFDDGNDSAARTPSHTYADDDGNFGGSYTVSILVTDDHGNTGFDDHVFQLHNVAPTPLPEYVDGEGQDGNLGTPDDPRTREYKAVPQNTEAVFTARSTTDRSTVDEPILSYRWDFGDDTWFEFGTDYDVGSDTGAAFARYGNAGGELCHGYGAACSVPRVACSDYADCIQHVQHLYVEVARYAVLLTATDKDAVNNTTTVRFDLEVTNDVPRISVVADPDSMAESDDAGPVAVATTVLNPIPGAVYTFGFDWDDDTAPDEVSPVVFDEGGAGLPAGCEVAGGRLTCRQEHVYEDDGDYFVSVSVQPAGGVRATSGVSISVANVLPVPFGERADADEVREGVPVRFRGGSTDVSPTDPITHWWDFDAVRCNDADAPAACCDDLEGEARLDAATCCDAFSQVAHGDAATYAGYSDDGRYVVCVGADDGDNPEDPQEVRAAAWPKFAFQVDVTNLAPRAVVLTPDIRGVEEGVPFTVEGGGVDVPNDTIVADAFEWVLPEPCVALPVGDGAAEQTARRQPQVQFRCMDDGVFAGSLRVRDEDGGISDEARFLVTIDNVRPQVRTCLTHVGEFAAPVHEDNEFADFPPDDCIAGQDTIDEGEEVVFSAFADDRSAADGALTTRDTVSFTWDLGDGSPPRSGWQVRHSFDRTQPTYVVRVTAGDDDGGEQFEALVVQVSNVEPTVEGPGGLGVGVEVLTAAAGRVEGVPIWFRGTATDPSGRDLTYLWSMGPDPGEGGCADLIAQNVLAEKAGVERREVSFRFPDNGDYVVCLRVRDEEGAESPAPVGIAVAVANVPPTAEAGPDLVIDEGEEFWLLDGYGTDPGTDEALAYQWDFGDCNAEDAFDSEPASIGHTYVDEKWPQGCVLAADASCGDDAPEREAVAGTRVVRLAVRDKDDAVHCDWLTTRVRNVLPTLPPLPTVATTEGVPTDFFDARFGIVADDPGLLDVLTYTFSWGDGSDCGAIECQDLDDAASRSGGVSVAHTYAQDERYNARLCARDDATPPAESCRPFTVRVDNAPPVVWGVSRSENGDYERAVQPEERTAATLDQGVINCLPVLVQDTGVPDHAVTACTIVQGPPGVGLVSCAEADAGVRCTPIEGFPDWNNALRISVQDHVAQDIPELDQAAADHVPCLLCWEPPESSIDPEGEEVMLDVVSVQVTDDDEETVHDWDLTVRIVDSDDDGMPNTYERVHDCLDFQVADGDADPDNDGLTSVQEYERGGGSDPCGSNLPSAPAVAFPEDGAEINALPAVVGVSNATDADASRVYPEHDDLRPLHYLFRYVEGDQAPAAAPTPRDAFLAWGGFAGCQALTRSGARLTPWVIDGDGDGEADDLTENRDYTWRAWACDGYGFGEPAGGRFFFSAINERPTSVTLRSPANGAEDQPKQPTFEWTCARFPDDRAFNTGDPDRDPVSYELEIRVRGESRPFLRRELPPCGDDQEIVTYLLEGTLAEDRWYEWVVWSVDDEGLRDEDPMRWELLVNPDNVEPRAPLQISPITDPLPPADDRLPGFNVTEVDSFDVELVFQALQAPDTDGNVLSYVVEVDTSAGFDSGEGEGEGEGEGAAYASEPQDVLPGEQGSWTVALDRDAGSDAYAENRPYWWRVRGVDEHGPGRAATTLVFVNTVEETPTPGGAGEHRQLDSRAPILVADVPPPADPDRDPITCAFELVRVAAAGACPATPEDGGTAPWCDPSTGAVCPEGAALLVATADGVAPEAGGAVGWKVPVPLENRAPHCWRHRCCDETARGCGGEDGRDWGAWSDWYSVSTNAPNDCPRGIVLTSPDSGEIYRLAEGKALPALTVSNAIDPDFGTDLCYHFQVFADAHLSEAPLLEACIPGGAEGLTSLDLSTAVELCGECGGVQTEATGGDSDAGVPMFDAYAALVALAPAPGYSKTVYWRARARDEDAECGSEWTKLGRFVLTYNEKEPEGCLNCAVAAGSRTPAPGRALPWLLLVGPLAVGWARRRVASARSRR